MTTSPPSRSPPWPLIIFGATLAVGLAMVLVVFRNQSMVDTTFDPYYFGAMGKSLARGQGFAGFGELIRRRSPLYPLIIGALYWLFGERPVVVQLMQCLCLAGTCVLVYDLGRRMFNTRTGLVAAVLCAVHPMMLRYVADLHLETLFTFLFTLLVWMTVRFYQRPTAAVGAQLGAVAALACLTKAVPLLYPPLFAGILVLKWLGGRAKGTRLPVAGLAAMFALMAAVIAPWTVRNYLVTGHFVPIATGASDAFLRGYIFSRTEFITLRQPPYTDAENETNRYFRALCAEAGVEWERNDWETDQVLNKVAKARLKAEPLLFVRKFVVGLFTFWYELTSLANSLLVGVLAVAAWALAAVGLRRARTEDRPAWLLIAPVLYLNVLLALLLALGRYSAPVLPSLLVVSAFGVDTLWGRLRARRA